MRQTPFFFCTRSLTAPLVRPLSLTVTVGVTGGGAVTVEPAALVPVPAGVVTAMVPVVAPVNCVPVKATTVPTGPEVGVKLVSLGAGRRT